MSKFGKVSAPVGGIRPRHDAMVFGYWLFGVDKHDSGCISQNALKQGRRLLYVLPVVCMHGAKVVPDFL